MLLKLIIAAIASFTPVGGNMGVVRDVRSAAQSIPPGDSVGMMIQRCAKAVHKLAKALMPITDAEELTEALWEVSTDQDVIEGLLLFNQTASGMGELQDSDVADLGDLIPSDAQMPEDARLLLKRLAAVHKRFQNAGISVGETLPEFGSFADLIEYAYSPFTPEATRKQMSAALRLIVGGGFGLVSSMAAAAVDQSQSEAAAQKMKHLDWGIGIAVEFMLEAISDLEDAATLFEHPSRPDVGLAENLKNFVHSAGEEAVKAGKSVQLFAG